MIESNGADSSELRTAAWTSTYSEVNHQESESTEDGNKLDKEDEWSNDWIAKWE